jgi:beta-glucosidase
MYVSSMSIPTKARTGSTKSTIPAMVHSTALSNLAVCGSKCHFMDRRELIKKLGLAAVGVLFAPYTKGLTGLLWERPFTRSDFGDDFLWGTATAAYQIEGAWDADGKGPSIWDTFSHKRGKIHNNDTGDVACDLYNRYASDVALVKELNMDVFRFSVSWSRVLPQGTGAVEQRGIDFYHRVIDSCLENGVQPWITLYHWDLPQALQDKGGWKVRDSVQWFSEYADLLSRTYGDKVKNWMVLNEPAAFTAVGHLLGIHAPGKRWPKNFLPTVHHAALCQAEGARVIRRNVPDARIGSTFSCSPVHPVNGKPVHDEVVKRMDVLLNRLFLEPGLGMGYPMDDLPLLRRLEKWMLPGDAEKMAFDFDFHGLQNYTRTVVRGNHVVPYVKGTIVHPRKLEPTPEITDMGWEVYPSGIHTMLKRFAEYPGVRNIIVTENGAAFPDVLEQGRVHDARRIAFYQDYLAEVLRAKREGVNVTGYFCWTLLDNFEWAEGYRTRFGLVHVDHATQERTIKDSGLWFKEFLARTSE